MVIFPAMHKLLVLGFISFFALVGLVESTHAHQLLQDDCCLTLCQGGCNCSLDAAAAQYLPPQPPAVVFAPPVPFFVLCVPAEEIFHPPLV